MSVSERHSGGGISRREGGKRGKERTLRGEEDGSMLYIYIYEDSIMEPTKHFEDGEERETKV
jgi:hypothetical protein